MQKSFELKPDCKLTFTYTYDYDEAYPEALKVANTIRFPGFRKGHAPFGLVVRSYGLDALFDSAFSKLMTMKDLYRDLDETGHNSMFYPEFSTKPVKKGEPVVYEVVWTIEPQVELGEYKGTKLTVPEETVTDEMIDNRIQAELRKQTSFTNITDRPCQNGDMVTVDYAGTIDGVAFAGGSADNASFRLGEHTYLPELEDGIVGMSVGEEKDVNVHFPETYDKSLAGKDAVFHVKLSAIVEEKLPELDDDFVQDISDFDTVEEYRESVRKALQKEVEDRNRRHLSDRIIEHVENLSKIDISGQMMDMQTQHIYDTYVKRYAAMGQDYEKMLENSGLGKQFGIMMCREEAERLLKSYVITQKLVSELGIEVTDEDIENLMEESREELGDRYDELVERMTETDKDALREECQLRKLGEAMKELMEITFVAPDDPSLKPAAPEASNEQAEEKAAEDGKE